MREARETTPEDIVRAAFRMRYGKSGDKEATALFKLLTSLGLRIHRPPKTAQEMCDERDRLLALIASTVLGDQTKCVSAMQSALPPLASGGG